MRPEMNNDIVVEVVDKKYLKMFDLQYAEGRHYFNATRRSKEDLMCLKTSDEFKKSLPDAVTCVVILVSPDKEEKLLMVREYRYPLGQIITSPPAGVLDKSDKDEENPIITAAKREIKEETGVSIKDDDDIFVINSLLFSTPGMTDESNAYVCAVVNNFSEDELSQSGAEETELFDGFYLSSKEDALRMLKAGTDDDGYFYSAATYIALTYFLSEAWKDR